MAHYRKQCISFFMTTKCNLACSYCYVGKRIQDGQAIDLEFAKQGIRDFFVRSKSRHIRFYGAGEPTLELEKIRAIREFAFELAGDSLKVEIQTNGFFPANVATWLANNMDIIWISLDGPPDIQDMLRPTVGGGKTSEVVERNIAVLLNQRAKPLVGVRATITPSNLYRQIEMIEYFCGLGITAVFSDPVFPPVETDSAQVKKLYLDENFMMEYAREFLHARKRAKELGVFYGSILTVNFDEKTEYFCRACLPNPHLTTDGFVSCCDMAFLGNALPGLIYGRFDPTTGTVIYDQSKITAIRSRKASKLAECQGCEVLYHCAGTCLGEGINETGRLLGVKKDYCEAIRFLSKHMPLGGRLYPYLHP
jgi:uncharacterized protein